MNIRMGLYAVGKEDVTKRRTARRGVSVFGEIAATHLLSDALVAEHAARD